MENSGRKKVVKILRDSLVACLTVMLLMVGLACSISHSTIRSAEPVPYHLSKQKPVIHYNISHSASDTSFLKIFFLLPEGVTNVPAFKIHFRYSDDNSPNQIADSGSYNFPEQQNVYFKIPVIIHSGSRGNLRLKMSYSYNYAADVQNFFVDKFSKGEQFFNYSPEPADLPVNIIKNDLITVRYYDPSVSILVVSYYNKSFPPSPAPFFPAPENNYYIGADTFFQIANGGTFKAEKPGIYKITINKGDLNGLTLFRYEDEYPFVNTIDMMAKTTRYITKANEYARMNEPEYIKIRLDSFWLARTGQDINESKELIKLFYNRVQQANQLFTSYKEGWKTDRGMIYIIYGEPDKVYRSGEKETWKYNPARELPEMDFFFNRTTNPFTLNDYELKRRAEYYDSWRVASYLWRKGLLAE